MAEVALPRSERRPPCLARADFQIVPLRGLPIVAAVAVALIARDRRQQASWALEFFHVRHGALWTGHRPVPRARAGPHPRAPAISARVEMTTRADAEGAPRQARRSSTATLAAGWQLPAATGHDQRRHADHGWIVASYIVVGVMAVIALGLLEPANVAVLFELKKPPPEPGVIERL